MTAQIVSLNTDEENPEPKPPETGLVCALEMVDSLTDWAFSIRLTPDSTVVSLNGREFWFDRHSGKYIGAGSCL